METFKWEIVSKKMPPRNKFVLISTPYCKYPFCSGYYNGIAWHDSDKKVIENVKFWAFVNPPY